MTLVLTKSLFTNNEYVVAYADRQATFTIVDETILGSAGSKVINALVCTVRFFQPDGAVDHDTIGSLVIGLGDSVVGVTTTLKELRGSPMTQDTMDKCVVELYES